MRYTICASLLLLLAACSKPVSPVDARAGNVDAARLKNVAALDANSGKQLWTVDTLIDRDTRSYTITGPPQVAKNVVVIGNSRAEFGVRGYVTAYDLDTGALGNS